MLKAFWSNIDLVDFKLEFGKTVRRHDRPGRRDQPRHLPPLGRRPPTKSWTRTASAATWAAWKTLIRKS